MFSLHISRLSGAALSDWVQSSDGICRSLYPPDWSIQVVGEKGETAERDVGHVPARYDNASGRATVASNVRGGGRRG